MSIHVTVNADPVCIRRGGLMLSDLEQIKKYERGRRRRLRLEQVRQQSKNIASKILEQTKNIARRELHNLETNEDSKLKRMHEQKIMEIQRRYQEDMEDIGMAHEAAQSQPNPDVILKSKKLKNQITANERGKEAAKRVKETTKIDDEQTKQQERLRQVREIEDIRSAMISNLPKKISTKKREDPEPSIPSSSTYAPLQPSSSPTNPSTSKTVQQSPKKRKGKKIGGKSSNKSSPNAKIQITTGNSKKSTSPQRIRVEVHSEDQTELNPTEIEYIQVPCNSQCYRKKDSDPENTTSTQIPSNRAEKSSRYNPSDYQHDVCGSSNGSSISSLISDDSSYFSDRPTPTINAITSGNLSSSKHYPSLTNSEIQVYDHITRRRNSYNHPMGIVEREDIQSVPNAEEMAQKILQMENNNANTIDNQRLIAQKRGNDAMLRDKVRRDYRNLMKNLDHLSREERKLKATQINNHSNDNNYIERNRRRDLNEMRQRKMERAFDDAQNNIATHSEAIITIHGNTESPKKSDTAWESPPFNDNNDDDDLSREEQILEMLKKVERQKRLLLQEFGATLPNDIFSATMTPLFNETKSKGVCRKSLVTKQTTASPEIEVINVSKSSGKKSQKSKKKIKKTPQSTLPPMPPPKITSTPSATSEIAVQTQIQLETDKNAIGEDKSIQVELSPELISRSTEIIGDTSSKFVQPEHIEPIVTIITHGNSDTSSTDTSNHGMIINVGRGRVEVSPRKSQKRVKTRSLPSSEYCSPIQRLPMTQSTSTSAPASRAATPEQNYHDTTDQSSTSTQIASASDTEQPTRSINTMTTQYSRVTKVSVGTDASVTNASSTIESHETSTKPYVLPRKQIIYKEASDTSTSYASLPPVNRQTHNNGTANNITSILELVDSSANETINRMRNNISPVSTPETPSPRTMRIPSNLPNATRLTRVLTFDERTEPRENDSTHEESQKSNQRRVIRRIPVYQRANVSSCSCPNPKCKEFHQHSNEDDELNVGVDDNQLAAMKRDEELQNSCAKKIAGLNALLKQIRDEKSGIEFSMFAPSDDTSLMQMPEPRSTPGNHVLGLQNLLQSIEHIHNQLMKTLAESEKQLMTKRIKVEEISLSPIVNERELTIGSDARGKPRIVSDERVHFDIQRIRRVNGGSPAIDPKDIYQSDDGGIVEKLSQEILEQSKDVEKSMVHRDLAMEKTPEKSDKWEDKEESEAVEYSPVLTDIPKIPNKLAGTPLGNGLARADQKFVRPDLSTIDELDTTDTANRSRASVNRSPTKKPQQSPITTSKNSSNRQKYSPTNESNKNDKQTSPISILKESQQPENQHGDTGENLPIEKSVKSPDSFLTHYSTRNIGAGDFFNQINIKNAITEYETQIKCEKITSSSSNSLSGFSGISEILTSTSSELIAASPPENMEFQLKKLGLSWLIPIAKKTRKASALSSSSNSDTTLTINKRTKSSMKKLQDGISCAYLDFSDVSSISIREASKSTEKTVLMKARTSTPNIPNFYYTSEKSNLTTSSAASGKSLQHDYSDSLVASKTLAIH